VRKGVPKIRSFVILSTMRNVFLKQYPSFVMYPLSNLKLIINGVPLALDNPSLVLSQYFVGTTPRLMQLRSAPLSMRAIVLTEKSYTVKFTMEYHFEN